jgi:hypothetical protein
MPSLFESMQRQQDPNPVQNQPGPPLLRSTAAEEAGQFFGSAIRKAGGAKNPAVELNNQVQGKIKAMSSKGITQNSPEFFKGLSEVFFKNGLLEKGQELAKAGFDLEKQRAEVAKTEAEKDRTIAQTGAIPEEITIAQDTIRVRREELANQIDRTTDAQERTKLMGEELEIRKSGQYMDFLARMASTDARLEANKLAARKNATAADVKGMANALDQMDGGRGFNSPEARDALAKIAADLMRGYESGGMSVEQATKQALLDVQRGMSLDGDWWSKDEFDIDIDTILQNTGAELEITSQDTTDTDADTQSIIDQALEEINKP